jgi:casein kinase 1
MNVKANSHTDRLFNAYPKEFTILLDYTCALQYEETPDYQYLRKLFRDLLAHEGHKHDYAFDWCLTTPPTTTSPSKGVAIADTTNTPYVQKTSGKTLTNHRV